MSSNPKLLNFDSWDETRATMYWNLEPNCEQWDTFELKSKTVTATLLSWKIKYQQQAGGGFGTSWDPEVLIQVGIGNRKFFSGFHNIISAMPCNSNTRIYQEKNGKGSRQFYLPSRLVNERSFREQGSSVISVWFETKRERKPGCFGWGKGQLSLVIIERTSVMKGRSTACSWTHNKLTWTHLSATFSGHLPCNALSMTSWHLRSFHNSHACEVQLQPPI